MRQRGTQAATAHSAGVTLVELLVALAIFAVITSFLFTTFATTTRSIEIGEARQDVTQNARAALALMAREIETAVIDARNRDFAFVCADGLNSLPQARIEFAPAAHATITTRGVGNAQHPVGLDLTANGAVYGTYGQVFNLYRSPLGTRSDRIVSVKPNDPLLPIGPPDRLDFVGLAANLGGFTTNPTANFAELRYLIAADSFNDGENSDFDAGNQIDAADSTLPSGTATWTGTGDVLTLNNLRAEDLRNLVQLGLYRAVDTTPDNNLVSIRELPRAGNVLNNANDPGGRYPFRDFSDLTIGNGGERIGAFIYDLQFEFYGRIATQLDANGVPTRFGIGWGYQDARGEDTGADGDPTIVDADGTQSNGVLDPGEDLGTDNVQWDPDDDASTLPDNVSDNDGIAGTLPCPGTNCEESLGENNDRLDSRVMGVWDSRAPDPRNPRTAREFNGVDDDGDAATLQADGIDNDGDGVADDTAAVATGLPETTGTALFDSTDDAGDVDAWRDDRFYDSAGKPEGVDEPDEGDPTDDTLPRAVRITITVRDAGRVLDPAVLTTTVWLSTAA